MKLPTIEHASDVANSERELLAEFKAEMRPSALGVTG
jgi:hypothetical protein